MIQLNFDQSIREAKDGERIIVNYNLEWDFEIWKFRAHNNDVTISRRFQEPCLDYLQLVCPRFLFK
jgi:hypothetical protein